MKNTIKIRNAYTTFIFRNICTLWAQNQGLQLYERRPNQTKWSIYHISRWDKCDQGLLWYVYWRRRMDSMVFLYFLKDHFLRYQVSFTTKTLSCISNLNLHGFDVHQLKILYPCKVSEKGRKAISIRKPTVNL